MVGMTLVEQVWRALVLQPAAPHLLTIAADWLGDYAAPAVTCDSVRAGVYSPSPINPKGFGEYRGSGYGDGYGDGYGYGSGSGDGSGYGSGYGYGSGAGYGYGSGSGDGYGSGDGDGSGYGDGYGYGYG
jgi:hypothetical protein